MDADFTLSTTTVLSFAANATESTGTVTITTVDNDVDAPDKTIQVKGAVPGGIPVRTPADVTLTITDDDDPPELGLAVSPATIAEGGGVATVTVSTTGTSIFADNQTITLTFAGTATKGTDYTVSSETLTLNAGERSVTSTVSATDDTTDESDETVLVTATHDGTTVGTEQQITIADTLAAILGAHSANVTEGSEATFAVDLSGGTSTADVEVSYEVDASSTATSGTDYTAPSGKLTITAGESSGTITIATLTDQVLDPDETLVVKLTSATTDTRTVTVDETAKKTTIISDTGEVSVSVAAVEVEDNPDTQNVDESDDRSSVAEGETAGFVVTLSGAVSSTVSVPYTTADVTAEAGADKDYTEASGTLEFTAGQTSKTIEVTTLEDVLNEADETYTLTLTSVTGPAGVKLGTASATGTIEDDDPISAALGTTFTTSVAEGGEATYEVVLSGGTSTAEVVVNYAADASSTATSGTDYTAPSGTLTIAAGASNGTITIATLTDDVLDPGETVVVKLTSATTDTRTVNVDATATKTTTIQEEDMVAVSVAAVQVEDNPDTQDVDETDDRSSVAEGETASFVVTLDGTVSSTVSVPYTTADVTAEAGADKDYTEASGTLEFTAGQTSKTIEVTTLEDVLNEADETYTLTLTSVTGPAGVKLGTASATGTIEDDDPISAALGTTFTASVAEGGEATYEVGLSGGTSTANVEVNYAVDTSSSATSGDDYTAPSGTLTIAAGASNGTITIATCCRPAGGAKPRQVELPRRATVCCQGSARDRCHDGSADGRRGGSVEEVIGDDVGGVDDFDVAGSSVQDGAVAERVDEARDAVGVAVDVGLGVIGEERGGTSAASGVVVDVAAGFLQGHGRHVVGDADALADGGEGSVLEQLAQFGLAGEHERDVGAGVEFKVHHTLDGGESGGGEVLGVVDDDDGFAVQFGNGLEEQLVGPAGEERRIDFESFEDGLDESRGGEPGATDVERGVAVAVEGGDEGGESDRLAAADGTGEQQQVLVGDAEGEA